MVTARLIGSNGSVHVTLSLDEAPVTDNPRGSLRVRPTAAILTYSMYSGTWTPIRAVLRGVNVRPDDTDGCRRNCVIRFEIPRADDGETPSWLVEIIEHHRPVSSTEKLLTVEHY